MTETPSNSHDGAASPRYPTQAIANESTGLCLPYRCSASGLCSALLPAPVLHVSTIASFLDGRPPYKSNSYCHPGRAGGTPMLLGCGDRELVSKQTPEAVASAVVRSTGNPTGLARDAT